MGVDPIVLCAATIAATIASTFAATRVSRRSTHVCQVSERVARQNALRAREQMTKAAGGDELVTSLFALLQDMNNNMQQLKVGPCLFPTHGAYSSPVLSSHNPCLLLPNLFRTASSYLPRWAWSTRSNLTRPAFTPSPRASLIVPVSSC